jgi:hypothetical protein
VGIVVFGVLGVMVGGIMQSIGAVLLIASTLGLAIRARQTPARSALHRDPDLP